MDIKTWAVLAILVLYGVIGIAGIIKRGLLSRLPVWSAVMFTVPAAMGVCVYAVCAEVIETGGALFSGTTDGLISAAITVLLSITAFMLLIVLYVTGNISPADKNSPALSGCGKERLNYVRARRLVITGSIGTVVYLAAMIAMVCFLINLLWSDNLADTLAIQVFMLFLLFIPILNIISIVYYLAMGVYMAAVCLVGIMAVMELILVINGCIRFVVASDKTKGMKALFIFLSIIPVFNIVYGFYCIKKSVPSATRAD